MSAPLLRPTPTATPVATPTPTPTITVTPTVTPTIGTSPTPTPSITPTNVVLGAGIVTLINGVQITEIDGEDIYPLRGIVTFEDYQVQGFDGENVNPF